MYTVSIHIYVNIMPKTNYSRVSEKNIINVKLHNQKLQLDSGKAHCEIIWLKVFCNRAEKYLWFRNVLPPFNTHIFLNVLRIFKLIDSIQFYY